MRYLALLALVPSAALAPDAVAQSAQPAPKAEKPQHEKRKGKIIDPWARNPRARDKNAPAQPAPPPPAPTADTPQHDKPKGRIIDPFGRIPRPRDKMRLPNPRAAAEKAAVNEPVAPVPPEPTPEPPREQLAAEPATAPVPPAPSFAPPQSATPPLPPPRTPFGTTTFSHRPPPPVAPHEGLTLEAGTGLGWIHLVDRYNSVTSPGGVAGLSIGVGGWLNEHVALTARLAGSSVPSSNGLVVAAYFGPALQFWITDRTWFGAGVGLASFGIDGESAQDDYSLGGYGADFRLGHAFYANGKHMINASLEITPSRVSEERQYGDVSLTVASIGILFGWQYL